MVEETPHEEFGGDSPGQDEEPIPVCPPKFALWTLNLVGKTNLVRDAYRRGYAIVTEAEARTFLAIEGSSFSNWLRRFCIAKEVAPTDEAIRCAVSVLRALSEIGRDVTLYKRIGRSVDPR